MDRLAGISSTPVGTFRAVDTRDGEAHRRDGEPVFSVRRLDDETVEVLFGDGRWMLCAPTDVERP